MKLYSFFAGVALVGMSNAVDMSRYDPQYGVEPAFEAYLKELYNQTEILNATTSFLDFFYPPGVLKVLGQTYTGSDMILQAKHMLLPPTGNKRWSHFPNITKVDSENSTQKVYYVQGIIDSTYIGEPNNNCSAAYYQSHFTLQKESDGTLNLTPHSGNLVIYDDFVVDPPTSPTNITCAT